MNRCIVDALAIEYSYDELLEIAAGMRREMARRSYIERVFATLSGVGHLEDMLFWCYQRRLAQTREFFAHNGIAYRRTAYANLKADPSRYAARLRYKAEHKRKQRQKTAPGYARGERSGGAKLTAERVRYVLSSLLSGSALARELGVSQATISGIRNRTKWKHVGQPEAIRAMASKEGA